MIKVRGAKAVFTGKDAELLKKHSIKLGLSEQDTFTGMLWEYIMKRAREGAFKRMEKGK